MRVDPDDPLHSSRDPYDDTPSFIRSLGAAIDPDLPDLHEDDLDCESHLDLHWGREEGGHARASQAAAPSSSFT